MQSDIKPLQVSQDPKTGNLHIENYPNAAHLAAATGESAEELRDLWLCRVDVLFAHRNLVLIATLPKSTESFDEIQDALWLAAIVSYFKCFQQGVRRKLTKEEVFADRLDAIAVFDYFLDLRNRHLVHDVNAFLQCSVGIAVNPLGAQKRIADAVAFPVKLSTSEEDHVSRFLLLITSTQAWLDKQVSALFKRVCEEYEIKDHQELLKLPPMQFTVPHLESVGKRRQ